MARYFSNSVRHCASESGGKVPLTGCHSTIDRPDSVRRVAPPTSTMTKIKAATTNSQARMAWRRAPKVGTVMFNDAACDIAPGPYRAGHYPAIARGGVLLSRYHDAHSR